MVKIKCFGPLVFVICSLLPLQLFSEELSAFANTSPEMSIVQLSQRQLAWQQKHRTRYKVNNCARGKAKAWFSSNPTKYFRRFSRMTRISSIEVIKFSNDTHLLITHVGCEYFTVFIRFEFMTKDSELDSLEGPYVRVLEALQQLQRYGKKYEFRTKKAILHVENLIAKNNIPNIGEWTLIKGDGKAVSQAQFSLLNHGVIRRKPTPYGFVEFALGRGPL